MQEKIQIQVKRQKGARSMRLKIGRDGQPVLTLPFWVPKTMGLIWAQKQQAWIQQNTFEPIQFYNTQKISFLGQEVTIQHTLERAHTHVENGVLWVSGQDSFLQRRVSDFIKKEFLIYLRPCVIEKEKKLGVKHSHITLRDTFSRWGSCSSNGGLSFCWRLAMAPLFVIDYLVAHEVAHLKHMNHSPSFWETVQELTPYTEVAKKWLKENGHQLHYIK